MHDTIIIGAGPAGIGAGMICGNSGVVIESSERPGGLCQSLTLGGAVFDLGGHSFHTPHPDLKARIFSTLPMFEQRRDARCFVDGQLIPYPFQQNFHMLDNDTKIMCEAGLKMASGGANAANYAEFLQARFGRGIAEKFMLPYNRKLWGADLQRLVCD
jgi:protoporphyrinogen oxidase